MLGTNTSTVRYNKTGWLVMLQTQREAPESPFAGALSWGSLSVREREAGTSSKVNIREKLDKPGVGTRQSL